MGYGRCMVFRRWFLCTVLVAACSDDAAGQAPEGPPEVQLIGRFDTSTSTPATAWPGGRIVVRFEGKPPTITLTQRSLPGSTTSSFFNVIVDGTFRRRIEVSGQRERFDFASDFDGGVHVLELEKRTEANVGTVVLEDVSFPDGGTLLAPPPRKARRIEFLADSNISGYGVEGDASTCNPNGRSPEHDNVRKSAAHFIATALDAESHLIAYSGKGIVKNEPGDDGENFPALYLRTLPDDPSSKWDFDAWTPDVVVIALGGTDITSPTPPAGFREGYEELVTSIRKRHPDAHVFMTIWSQIKDLDPPGFRQRSTLKAVLDDIKAAHATDAKLHVFQWKEADYPVDETGCAEHANEAHGKEAADEIVPVIKAATGWK